MRNDKPTYQYDSSKITNGEPMTLDEEYEFVQEGIDDLGAGRCLEINGDAELKQYLDSVKSCGHRLLAECDKQKASK